MTFVAHKLVSTEDLTVNDDLTVGGDFTVTGAFTQSGAIALNGNVTIGDSAADLVTINATIQGGTPLVFEGATANAHETSFAITDPTADRTITFPDATGTVQVSGQGLTVGTNGTAFTLIQKFTGTVASGQTSVAISATGVAATDHVVATLQEVTTNAVYIRAAVPTTNTITVTLSGDPGASNADLVAVVFRS